MASRDLLERHLASGSAAPAQRASVLAALTSAIKEDLKEGRESEVADALRLAALPTLDLASLQAL
jgi:hypothetical protein